jgi:hypothetical protein
MATPSLQLGSGNWAVKSDSLLGYALPQGKYVPREFTVTRATTATRVNETGLVQLVPYNLASWSEMFTDASWVKTASTITANTTTAPNGTLTADTLTGNGASSSHSINQAIPLVIGNTYTISVYAKKGTNNFLQIYGFSTGYGVNTWANFDLNNGVLGSIGSSATATITNVGDGWYRCTITFVALVTVTDAFLFNLITSATSGRGEVSTLTTSVFIWGAQLVEGTAPLTYLPTTTRLNIPRIDYSTGSANLLLEPQRTNLALRSEQFDDAVWTSSIGGTGVLPIRTANSVISPSGIINADTIVFNRGAGNTLTDQCVISQPITVPTTGTYYFTCWMKATTIADVGKQVLLRCGNAASLQPFTLTANWTRFETTATVTSGSANSFQIGNRGTITTGNSVSVDLWGAQLEAGAYSTSYIPTSLASVTRITDVISRANIFTNGYITSAGGTWFVEIRNNIPLLSDNSGDFILLGVTGSVSDNFLRISGNNVAASRLIIIKRIGGINTPLYTTLTDTIKVAIKWNGTTADVFVNGVKVVNATSFTETNMQFLSSYNNVTKNINSMALYTTPLSDTECINMTL